MYPFAAKFIQVCKPPTKAFECCRDNLCGSVRTNSFGNVLQQPTDILLGVEYSLFFIESLDGFLLGRINEVGDSLDYPSAGRERV